MFSEGCLAEWLCQHEQATAQGRQKVHICSWHALWDITLDLANFQCSLKDSEFFARQPGGSLKTNQLCHHPDRIH